MLLFFHVIDETRPRGLQTGVYYADGTPKPSLAPIVAASRQDAAETGAANSVRA